jgi:AcrR family transcriptional regulator
MALKSKQNRHASADGVAAETAVHAELLKAATVLLKTHQPQQISTQMILKRAGVARGSLYYHFSGIDELIDRALIGQFSDFVTQNIERMETIVRRSRNSTEFLAGLDLLNETTHQPSWSDIRRLRARVIGLAERNPRLQQSLGREQDRLTDGIQALVVESQEKGFVGKHLDPHALALFMQAYTYGRILDDIAATKVDAQAWIDLLKILTRTFVLSRPSGHAGVRKKTRSK